jgi:hypothetical protein
MIDPLVVLFAALLHHWYEMVPPSGEVAATVNVTVAPVVTEVLAAGCVPMLGACAFTSAFTVIVITLLAKELFETPSEFITSQ